MTAQVFPSLAGLGWSVGRSPEWNTTVQESLSGKETAIGHWTYPRWMWSLRYDLLRSAPAIAELQSLVGFFNARFGRFDPFLFTDAEDNAVTAQAIGTGNAATTAFQLVRTYGGFAEPIFAPNAVTAVKLAGVTQAPEDYTIADYDSATPGKLIFDSAPGNGVAITADFSFRFPCRFLDDTLDFKNFMTRLWSADKVEFRSIK